VAAVGPVVKAKNGFVYLVGAPLLPPLPPLAELFVVPTIFSTLTSGVQKVELDLHTFHQGEHALDDEVHPVVYEVLDELKSELPPAKHFTVFAPTNGVRIICACRVAAHPTAGVPQAWLGSERLPLLALWSRHPQRYGLFLVV
jgi:hypothetical protein